MMPQIKDMKEKEFTKLINKLYNETKTKMDKAGITSIAEKQVAYHLFSLKKKANPDENAYSIDDIIKILRP